MSGELPRGESFTALLAKALAREEARRDYQRRALALQRYPYRKDPYT